MFWPPNPTIRYRKAIEKCRRYQYHHGMIEKVSKTNYPWEVGTQLAAAVQAKDRKAAEKHALSLLKIIRKSGQSGYFEEVKLRMVQILTIASRAAYAADGDPDQLMDTNLDFIDKMIQVSTQSELQSLVRQTIQRLIDLVPEKDLLESQRLKDALDYIKNHCNKPITRGAVAEHLQCSESYVSIIFARSTGHKFTEIVLRYRMEKAKELLRQSQKNVTEVAFDMGYKDPNYFSTCFRRVTGISPGQFRRKIS